MRDETLLEITVVTDDETGLYHVGDLDYGIPVACYRYLEIQGNRKRLADWLYKLAERCRSGDSPFKISEDVKKL